MTAATLDLHGEVSAGELAPVVPAGDRAAWIADAQERRRRILEDGCKRWPAGLRLVSSAGAVVPGRCRGTNLCDYCGILGGVEWSEMLALDALEGQAPTVYVCLTTSRSTLHAAEFHRARSELVAAIREEWAGAEYACLVEFTSGYAATSGGRRRPHWNLLLKGVPDDPASLERLRALVLEHWCPATRSSPKGQKVTPVWAAEGLVRYLALHFLKESQKPPRGWTGHRVTASHGYFTRGRRGAREAAQASLKLKRELWRAEREGLEGAEALTVAELRLEQAAGVRWECVALAPDVNGEVGRVVASSSSSTGTRVEWNRRRELSRDDTSLRPRRRKLLTLGELEPELFAHGRRPELELEAIGSADRTAARGAELLEAWLERAERRGGNGLRRALAAGLTPAPDRPAV